MNEFDRNILRQLFIDALTDYGVSLLDVEGKILTWNTGAQAILGYAAGEIVGKHFSCLYPDEDIAIGKPSLVLRDAIELGRHEERARRVRKDGSEVEVFRTLVPLYTQETDLRGFGVLARRVSTPDAAGAANRADVVQLRTGEQILVVDDDERVLEMALRQLTSLGYRAIAASNGAEALQILDRVPDIDLLITDVAMPGSMGGRDVAEQALQRRPGLKVLFVSGYFEGALVGKGHLAERVQFLVKPYRKKDLAQKVREVLSSTVS